MEKCHTCAVKWGKDLVIGCCACDGHVNLVFSPPTLPQTPKWEPTPSYAKPPEKDDGPKISAKERARIARALATSK